ncbi:MAG: GNAT family N-acetyltransferase [Magnetovibrionaceae bacterium]
MTGPSTSRDGPSGAVEIRVAAEPDVEAWRQLFRSYLDFMDQNPPDATVDGIWARIIDPDNEQVFGLLAFVDGQPAGLLNYILHPNTSTLTPVCYLEDLYVSETARCRGVARALIEDLRARGAKAGWRHVYWMTQGDNHSARALYDQVGSLTDWVRYNMTVQEEPGR